MLKCLLLLSPLFPLSLPLSLPLPLRSVLDDVRTHLPPARTEGPVSAEGGELLEYVPPHYLPQRYGGLLDDDPAERKVADEIIKAEVLDVAAGTTASKEVNVGGQDEGKRLTMVMRCLSKDIQCRFECVPPLPKDERPGGFLQGGSAKIEATQGVLRYEVPRVPVGTMIKVTFDNSYSWITAKRVLLGIELK